MNAPGRHYRGVGTVAALKGRAAGYTSPLKGQRRQKRRGSTGILSEQSWEKRSSHHSKTKDEWRSSSDHVRKLEKSVSPVMPKHRASRIRHESSNGKTERGFSSSVPNLSYATGGVPANEPDKDFLAIPFGSNHSIPEEADKYGYGDMGMDTARQTRVDPDSSKYGYGDMPLKGGDGPAVISYI